MDDQDQSHSDWMREQKQEFEHRRWLFRRLRAVGGWLIAAAWLVADGVEKWDKFITWMKR